MSEINLKEESILKEVLSYLDCEIQSGDDPVLFKNIQEGNGSFYNVNELLSDFDTDYRKYLSSKRTHNKIEKRTSSDCMQYGAKNIYIKEEPKSMHLKKERDSVYFQQKEPKSMYVEEKTRSVFFQQKQPNSMYVEKKPESVTFQEKQQKSMHIEEKPESVTLQQKQPKSMNIEEKPESVSFQSKESKSMNIEEKPESVSFQQKEPKSVNVEVKPGSVSFQQKEPESMHVEEKAGCISFQQKEPESMHAEEKAASVSFQQEEPESVYNKEKPSFVSFQQKKPESTHIEEKPDSMSFQQKETESMYIEEMPGSVSFQQKEPESMFVEEKSDSVSLLQKELESILVEMESECVSFKHESESKSDQEGGEGMHFQYEEDNIMHFKQEPETMLFETELPLSYPDTETYWDGLELAVYDFMEGSTYCVYKEHSYCLLQDERIELRKKDLLQKRKKKIVSRLSDEQQEVLELAYSGNKFPDAKTKADLSIDLGLSAARIRNWFRRRRERDTSLNKFDAAKSCISLIEDAVRRFKLSETEGDNTPLIEAGNSVVLDETSINDSESDSVPLSKEQTIILETFFKSQNNPNRKTKQKLADSFGLPFFRVDKWFSDKILKDHTDSLSLLLKKPTLRGILEVLYGKNLYPDQKIKERLAQILKIPVHKIYYWFVSRRRKQRRILEKQSESSGCADYLNEKKDTEDASLKEREMFQSQDNVQDLEEHSASDNDLEREFILDKADDSSNLTPYDSLPERTTVQADSVPVHRYRNFTLGKKFYLETVYSKIKYPDREKILELEKKLKLSRKFLTDWFTKRQKKDLILNDFHESSSEKPTVQMKSGQIYPCRNLTLGENIYLEEIYSKVQFPDRQKISDLGQILKVSRETLVDWFRERQSAGCLINHYQYWAEEQLQIMEAFYMNENCPSREEKQILAMDLQVPFNKVHKWFFNRLLMDKDISSVQSKFTETEKLYLDACYQLVKFPSSEEKERIARQLGVYVQKVANWFLTRRHKDKSLILNPVNSGITSVKDRQILEKSYRCCKNPNKVTLLKLEKRIRKPYSEICTWFYNRRELDKLESPNNERYLTEEQISVLKNSCKNDITPSQRTRKNLARKLGISYYRVTKWFCDRRPSTGGTSSPQSEEFSGQQTQNYYPENPGQNLVSILKPSCVSTGVSILKKSCVSPKKRKKRGRPPSDSLVGNVKKICLGNESPSTIEEQKPIVPFCYVEVPMGEFDNEALEESVKQEDTEDIYQ